MKTLQIFFAFLFIGFITWMLIKQTRRDKKLFHQSISGKVISAEKGRKGYYHLTLIQNGKSKVMGYTPGQPELMAWSGDSVYKQNNSDVFYIKKNEMKGFTKTDWKDCHISGRWDE